MPFIRPDEGVFEDEDTDSETNTGSFEYIPVEGIAYKPRPFDPAALTGATAVVYDILRSSGLAQFHVRYDGGHDEGFAHADGGGTADGAYRTTDAIASELATQSNIERLRTALAQLKPIHRHESVNEYYAKLSASDLIQRTLDDLAGEMASCMLGDGYGTGEYSMYGAFTVDLSSGKITDDQSAVQPPDISFD